MEIADILATALLIMDSCCDKVGFSQGNKCPDAAAKP